jgi:hypothetical protein
MSEGAPAAGATAEKKRPRVPTPVVVTLLGIGLSAWLLPAITRQWGDRQKAHELKAALVTDIASASSRVLLGGEALWRDPDCPGYPTGATTSNKAIPIPTQKQTDRCNAIIGRHRQRVAAKIDDPWAIASNQLETRLRAYVNAKAVTAWELYSWFVDRFDYGYRLLAEQDLKDAFATRFDLEPGAARAAAGLVRFAAGSPAVPDDVNTGMQDHDLSPDFYAYNRLKAKLTSGGYLHLHRYRPDGAVVVVDPLEVEAKLAAFEEEIAREVLSSHVTGYSTTTGDLFHDLIP